LPGTLGGSQSLALRNKKYPTHASPGATPSAAASGGVPISHGADEAWQVRALKRVVTCSQHIDHRRTASTACPGQEGSCMPQSTPSLTSSHWTLGQRLHPDRRFESGDLEVNDGTHFFGSEKPMCQQRQAPGRWLLHSGLLTAKLSSSQQGSFSPAAGPHASCLPHGASPSHVSTFCLLTGHVHPDSRAAPALGRTI